MTDNVIPLRRDYEAETRAAAGIAAGVTPPHDLDAEAAVLSSVMLDAAAIPKIGDFLKSEHFYSEAHRQTFHAASELHAKGSRVDIVTIASWLKEAGRIGQVGGLPYLTEVLNATPAIANVRAHAVTVYERWRMRQAIATAQRIAAIGYHGDTTDVQRYLDDATRGLGELARQSVGGGAESNIDALKRMVAALMARADGNAPVMRGLTYGFPSLDRMTGGMLAELIFVVALTGVGKTTFAINVARACLLAGIGVQVFSTETTKQEWLEALVSCHGHVDNAVWTQRAASGGEWARVTAAAQDIAKWKHLAIDATDAPDVHYVAAISKARADTSMKLDGKPLGLVIVDNLHCMSAPKEMGNEPKHVHIKRTAELLQRMAKSLGVPVMCLAQQRDTPFDRGTKVRPRPESGCIADCRQAETYAGKVFYLHRAPLERGGKLVGEDKERIQVIAPKARRTNWVDIELKLIGAHGRLVDVAGETQDRHDPLMPVRDWHDGDEG